MEGYNEGWGMEEQKKQRCLIHIRPVIGQLNMDDRIIDLIKKYRHEGKNTDVCKQF